MPARLTVTAPPAPGVMKQFLQTLDRYADRQVDMAALRRSIEQQLSAVPAAAPDILAALAAAERAGKIDAGETQMQADWLRSRSDGETEAKPPSPWPGSDSGVGRLPESQGSASGTASEGSILKGRYLLERKIGEGGMGVVFRARDLEEERIAREQQSAQTTQYLAIKVLRPDRREYSNAVLEEVRKTRGLVHQNIVRAGDCQQDGDQLFMTMEYLEGKTLDALLYEDFAQGMPWELARPIIQGMGQGLAFAHNRGLVHCDFKPSNVFITQSFSPKILDFGIARAARGGQRDSESGLPVGMSRRYASPEVIRAWQHDGMASYRPDRRDDIFALACSVFELLTARHPFGEGDQDAEQARQQQLSCPRVSGLSSRQNGAIAKAMALDREQRTARVEDFMLELIPSAPRGRSWAAIPTRLWAAAAGVVAVAAVAWSVAQWQRSRIAAMPPAVASPPVAGTGDREPATAARSLVSRLGIDPALMGSGAAAGGTDLPAVIRTAARRVQLGSTPAEIEAALSLCGRYSRTCPRDWYADEGVRERTLAPFVLDPEPVTVADFRAFVAATHYRTGAERSGSAFAVINGHLTPVPNGNWRNGVNRGEARDDWPAVAVNFDDAQAYCQWKGKRLPTEDEWEYAARGPDRLVFPWGNEVGPALKQSLVPPAVGAGPKEGIGGLFRDMSGMVWEWVNTALGDRKVLKGGSWLEANPANRRAAVHRYEKADTADADSGFRCAASAAAWPDAEFWLRRE
jgi:formylglycine-generating enzyme required for sulfatase activity